MKKPTTEEQLAQIAKTLVERVLSLEDKVKSLEGDINRDIPENARIERLATKLAVRIADLPPPVQGDKGERGEAGAAGRDGIDGKDGKDGRDGVDGKDGRDGIDGAPGEKGEPGSIKDVAPDEIRNALELLQGDERLDASAIKGLDEWYSKLKPKVNNGSYVIQRGQVLAYDLSPSLNGSTTTFSLPAFYRVIQVNLSSTPNILRSGTDYTTDGSAMTITFTSQINAANALAAGQSCIILYQTLV